MLNLLDNEELQRMVDYSFGDQSGVLGRVPNAYMKKANMSNYEFLEKVGHFRGKTMTLFIDNIRLYRRPIEYSDWQHHKIISPQDKKWLEQFDNEDLLDLCSKIKTTKFIIFTAFEDTPLDDYIKIPNNVLAIHSANAVKFGDKIHPFPHGLERKMYEGYDHQEILQEYLKDTTKPTKGLLVCHRDDTGNRTSIKDIFKDKDWATVAPKLNYEPYLQAIKDHKFVLCPSGNGIESARNWETLYMGRVPVFKDHPYLREMFKEFPAIFVKDWHEITEELLDSYQPKEFSTDLLDLKKIYDLRLLHV